MDELMKMPTEQELAEVVYKYCRTNNITYIREDELIKKIVDEEMQKNRNMLEKNYDLDEKGWGEDQEADDAITFSLAKYAMFTYKLSKRFYDIIDILIDENKASREKRDGERLYYLTFYLIPMEIESIKLVKSTIEILANDLYNYCKENNIEGLKKDDIKNIINLDDNVMIDKIIDYLVKKDMVRLYLMEDKCFLIFFLTESKIQLNKNMRLMTKNAAELFLDNCIQNDITYVEKGELQKMMDAEDSDAMFKAMLDYLVERHLADEEYNPEDGKNYIRMYY